MNGFRTAARTARQTRKAEAPKPHRPGAMMRADIIIRMSDAVLADNHKPHGRPITCGDKPCVEAHLRAARGDARRALHAHYAEPWTVPIALSAGIVIDRMRVR